MTWLGIDLGTSSVKVALVDDLGEVLDLQSASYQTYHPEQGAAEQNPDEWWEAIGEAVRALAPDQRTSIQAIGISGQMHGTVCLDASAKTIRPAIIWADTRGAQAAEQLTQRLGSERLATTIGTPVATGFQVVTLDWLRTVEPATFSAIAMVMLPKDFIRYRLTGVRASDPSDAASTGLLDVQTRTWSDAMSNAIGLDRSKLPSIVKSNEKTGELTPEAQKHLGIDRAVPVVAGGGDASLAALGTGITNSEQALITLSSGAQVTAFANHPAVDPHLRVHTFASPLDPDRGECGWYVMGATMSAGTSVHWVKNQILGLADWSVEQCMDHAGRAPAGSDGLIYVPHISGERTPHIDANASGAFIGLTADHDQRHIMRAVLEGTAFAVLDAWEVVTGLTGLPEDVIVAGGGAKSSLWVQIVADVLARPVRMGLVPDASAVGAAILAASGSTGRIASEISRNWARPGAITPPSNAAVEIYRTLAPIYRNWYPAFKDHFTTLRTISR